MDDRIPGVSLVLPNVAGVRAGMPYFTGSKHSTSCSTECYLESGMDIRRRAEHDCKFDRLLNLLEEAGLQRGVKRILKEMAGSSGDDANAAADTIRMILRDG